MEFRSSIFSREFRGIIFTTPFETREFPGFLVFRVFFFFPIRVGREIRVSFFYFKLLFRPDI